MALITLENVTIAFEGTVAVDRVSFCVERGDYLVILGENGSGKYVPRQYRRIRGEQ